MALMSFLISLAAVYTNKASETRKDNIHCEPGQQVHQEHCRIYCNPRQASKVVTEAKIVCNFSATEGHVLRSAKKPTFFNFNQTASFVDNRPCFKVRDRVQM